MIQSLRNYLPGYRGTPETAPDVLFEFYRLASSYPSLYERIKALPVHTDGVASVMVTAEEESHRVYGWPLDPWISGTHAPWGSFTPDSVVELTDRLKTLLPVDKTSSVRSIRVCQSHRVGLGSPRFDVAQSSMPREFRLARTAAL